ncbi:MAG TPA: SPOR domain-containing protein [Gemmatimonadaceae bacterium]|nr:SPOR domain-containing protein [Gemmatimonadaceae bacterium]
MRTLALLLCLTVAAACGDSPRAAGSAPNAIGPDALLLRVPAEGGFARAYRVGSDSALWVAGERTPAVASLLGFDDFQGLLIGADEAGRAFGVDLRMGGVSTLSSEKLRGGLRAEGGAVFGFDAAGRVLRLTPVAAWSWTPAGGADELVPNPDGSLMLLSSAKGRTFVRRLIPPEPRVLDSTSLPPARHVLRTSIGDRVWFDTDSGLIALRSRELTRATTIRLRDSVVAMAATPSGDRLYAATKRPELRVVDRFAERERGAITLPQPVTALRMDPDGHYLLARPATGDSVYVISVGTARMIGAYRSVWRADLPLVTPDGGVLLSFGRDAVLVNAETGRERMRYRGGADDMWQLVRWNGFRPRAAGLDRPVEFEEFAADSAAADSALVALMASRYGDFSANAGAAPPAAAPAPAAEAPLERAGRETWTVSFATLLVEDRARTMAREIKVDGRAARVIEGNRDGVPIWRVVLGPYDKREDAERAGMSSKLPYWVFEGVP